MPENVEMELREIRDMLTGLCASQREHGVEQRLLKEDLSQIKHVLIEGNGRPAMTVRLALVESEIERVRQERNDRKLPRAAWLGIVLSSVFSTIGLGIAIFKML
jgi:hypothetical protein